MLRRKKAPRRSLAVRIVRRVTATVVVLAVAWLGAGYLLVVHPHLNTPTKVDAILVLGPPRADGRSAEGVKLMQEGLGGTLVVSVSPTRQYYTGKLCRKPPSGIHIICFAPDPTTTQGEAREIGRLAKAHHWTSIMVVTSTYHISRARLIIKRCMPGKVVMVDTDEHYSFGTWMYQLAYQTGGFAKALIHTGC